MIAHVKPEARGLAGAAAEPEPSRADFLARAGRAADRAESLRDIAGGVDTAGHEPPTEDVRERVIRRLIAADLADPTGATVEVSAVGLALVPLMFRFSHAGRGWWATLGGPKWDAHATDMATLLYTIDRMPY